MPNEALIRARSMFESMMADATAAGEAATIENIRDAYEVMCSKLEVPASTTVDEVELGGVRCLDVRSGGAEPTTTIVWLHSGGYVIGSPEGYRSLGGHLALATGARVLLVDYRLAPEHAYPAALEDALSVYRAVVREQEGGAMQCVLAGDSAGGGLAVATLVSLRDAGDDLPRCAICCSPWTDLAQTGATIDSKADVDPAVARDMLEMCTDLYLGEGDRRSPLASPLYAELEGLPPMFVLVGSDEALLDDSRRLADRAKAANVSVELKVVADMIHIFPIFASFLPEAQAALVEMDRFISASGK